MKAFTFGKFLPFHKGHEAMIQFALKHCDHLTVLICCSDQEVISGEVRKQWLKQTFKDYPQVDVQVFDYREEDFPNSSESSMEISRIWSRKFIELFPDCKLVVTSEPYGDFVASCMQIKHLAFDLQKEIIPTSATLIREDLLSFWNYLPPAVKHHFAIKVVILGTESTGKTTLTNQLASYFNATIVQEAGRELIPDSTQFSIADLNIVAQQHALAITQAMEGNHPLIFVDTDCHITQSYARFVFNEDLYLSEEIQNANQAKLYLYLNNDVAYVQDGTRLSENQRNLLDTSHRKLLHEKNIRVTEIYGDWAQRWQTAVLAVENILVNILPIKVRR